MPVCKTASREGPEGGRFLVFNNLRRGEDAQMSPTLQERGTKLLEGVTVLMRST